ncbi:SCP2 sterol-binding domain-containing protein [Candidatus Ichthyocystis sparus]|uniref:SCP2 sterol-binding domain-containing protein n=1 Tax=Candidatus Ichthyocystis sparus TaxID=1561004 RepID=UPI0011471A38|nr:SCP2 sterol-binding domain-containing protein [Candidatus Ichthyocystis sparus]
MSLKLAMILISIVERLVVETINASLRKDKALRSYLHRHDNKIIKLSWKAQSWQYKIVHGQLIAYPQEKKYNLKIIIPDKIFFELSTDAENFSRKIVIEGETFLAQDIHFVAKNISIPLEEQLYDKIGPTASSIVMKVISVIADEGSYFARNLVDTIVGYGTRHGVPENVWQETLDRARLLSDKIDDIYARLDKLLDKIRRSSS